MPTDTKIDPFKPEQPHIPGVPDAPVRAETNDAPPSAANDTLAPPAINKPAGGQTSAARIYPAPQTASHATARASRSAAPVALWVALAAGIVLILAAAATMWWVHRASGEAASADTEVAVRTDGGVAIGKPVEKPPVAPGQIATAEELSRVWSSKRFVFRNPITSEQVAAVAVRLPGGALWGISLREPYGTCELAYVSDLAALSSQYKFAAQHPMVVNPCNGTVYDLARYGTGPNGWVRGEIVKGTAPRPPIGIEVVARGNKIIATRIE